MAIHTLCVDAVQKIGDFFVSIGALTDDEVEVILQRQRELKAQGDDDIFGMIAMNLGLIDESAIERYVEIHYGGELR
jgi:hypothetical protein